MAIPESPHSRVENYLGNLIGQETAWEPGNPESRTEEYLDYILNNGTKTEQEMAEEIEALKSIGRYLALWDCTIGKPTTDPKKLPYKYKAGDYYIVSTVGATNYKPAGTQYDGTASTTVDADAHANDYYIYDGTNWTRLNHSSVGNVSSVQVAATSPVQSSNATAQTGAVSTTLSLADAYGDTKNPYGSKTANYILAAPNGSAGAPSFRALVAADIPDLAASKITSGTFADARIASASTWNAKSTVSVSDTGTATDEVQYITIDGVEKKLAGGGSSVTFVDWS